MLFRILIMTITLIIMLIRITGNNGDLSNSCQRFYTTLFNYSK